MEQYNDYLSESADIRCSWNIFPQNKLDKGRYIVPVGFHYSPFKYNQEQSLLLEYDPLLCPNCSSVFNPISNIDFKSKAWECLFCLKKNLFPNHYAQNISSTLLPPEALPENSTVEYKIIKKELANQPIIFFLIDTAIDEEELNPLKEKIQTVIDNLPDEVQIGLLTFGTMANLLEIGLQEITKMHVFKGNKIYNVNDIAEILGLSNKNNIKLITKKYIQPKKECAFKVSSFLDELLPDFFTNSNVERKHNCGGLAINIAVSLLEIIANGDPVRIELFLGGAPNIGEGKVVPTLLKEPIRNFIDFKNNNDNIQYYKKAVEFYNNISVRASRAGQIIDVYSCSFNQVGLLELKNCVEKTGGYMILSDSFSHSCFKDTFVKLFETDSNNNFKFGFKAKMEAFITKPYTFSGALGYMSSIDLKLQKNLNMISKTDIIGNGNTRVWSLGGIQSDSTYSFILDVEDSNVITKRAVVQLVTYYIAGDLSHRMKVTTFKRKVAGEFNSSLLEIAQSFDQEAATVILAKYCVDKGTKTDQIEVLRWLDKTIIRLVTKFSEYKKDDIQSFKLNSRFNLFPQFMYYLRRSPFISDFNSSLDESVFYKSSLMNETMVNCTIMIQPILYVYTAENPEPNPVHLDIEHMKDVNVLYMDAFFFICIWHGATVANWRDKGLQEDPEYENIKLMLDLPQESAQETLLERLPVCKFISCDSGNGQERYIKFTVNPSCGNSEVNTGIPEGFYTDDVSIKKFWDHLRKKVVCS